MSTTITDATIGSGPASGSSLVSSKGHPDGMSSEVGGTVAGGQKQGRNNTNTMQSSHQQDPQVGVVSRDHLMLSISQSPTDGSLITVPLRTVINAMTHTLYHDLFTMATGSSTSTGSSFSLETDLPKEKPNESQEDEEDGGGGVAVGTATIAATTTTTTTDTTTNKKKPKKVMSTLSFAARRHELSIRLYRHLHSASHVTALVATYSSLASSRATTGSDFVVQICSDAFSETFVQTRCGQDEAQDALYFHHADLWKVRRHPHDIYGSTQLLLQGSWLDFPTDAQLLTSKDTAIARQESLFCQSTTSNQLNNSTASTFPIYYTKEETLARLQSCVRRKLLLGEIGQACKIQAKNNIIKTPWWNITLESNKCAIRLTYGTQHSSSSSFPIEARLTVLDYHEEHTPWVLLSLDIRAQPKTGESSHQLEPNNKQKYSLHRICDKAMRKEEGKYHQQQQLVAKPLDALFYVAHKFAVSLQLEILSAQAEALRRGTWDMLTSAATTLDGNTRSSNNTTTFSNPTAKDTLERYRSLYISPIKYIHKSNQLSSSKFADKRKRKHDAIRDTGEENSSEEEEEVTAIMAIHFWYVDDRYGLPKVQDVYFADDQQLNSRRKDHLQKYQTFQLFQYIMDGTAIPSSALTSQKLPLNIPPETTTSNIQSRFAVYIRAIPRKGLVVSLPGGEILRNWLKHRDTLDSNTSSIGNTNPNKNSYGFFKRHMDKLQASVHNPFSLSAADAILAATSLCAYFKCFAVVEALTKTNTTTTSTMTATSSPSVSVSPLLPLWMECTMDANTITISVKVTYDTKATNNTSSNDSRSTAERSGHGAVPLFRVMCDTRTGQFIPVFSSSTSLLRSCACHDLSISRNAVDLYNHQLRASSASAVIPSSTSVTNKSKKVTTTSTAHPAQSLPTMKRHPATSAVLKDLTGHIVRDAFDGLVRSIDNLSHKAGVGADQWDDYDTHNGSSSRKSSGTVSTTNSQLRANAVRSACVEVKQSLLACCGLAAVYGIGGSALSLASGVNAMIDMAGGIITKTEGTSFSLIPSPPVCVIYNQSIREEEVEIDDGIDEPKRDFVLEREGLAISGSVSEEYLKLCCFIIKTESSCSASVPVRVQCVPVDLPPPISTIDLPVESTEQTVSDNKIQKKGKLGLEIEHLADRLFALF